MPQSALINIIQRTCTKAARRMVRDFGEVENLQVSQKGVADFVSHADTDAEALIRKELAHARPSWGFIMEESGVVAGKEADSPVWIIDPIDGTNNYIHGIPHFAISIAAMDKPLAQGGKIIAGGIFDAIRNEFFFADAGTGAFLNGRRIRVSGRKNPAQALFATGIPHAGQGDAEVRANYIQEMQAVINQSAGIRRFGSAALDLAWVAAGRFDGFWEYGLNLWDIAAGVLIVKEAGGFVSDHKARDTLPRLAAGNIVAGNPSMHASLLKILQAEK